MITHRISGYSAILAPLTALLFLLVVSACAPAPAPSVPPTPITAPTKLKVLYLRFFSYAPYFIADAEGFFRAQGLDVELVAGGAGSAATQAVPALMQGEVDVLAGTIVPGYMNAMGRGGRIAFVADKGYIDPSGCATSGIVARATLVKGGSLNTAEKIRGLTMNNSGTGITGYMIDKYLAPKSVSLEDLKNKSIPDEILAESLKNGSLDLAYVGEPNLSRIIPDENLVLVASAEQLIPNFQYSMILYGPNLLDKNPEAGKKFMVAYLQAVRQYNQGKTDRNLDILTKATGLDREALRRLCWQPIHNDGHIDVPSILDFESYLVKRKLLDVPVIDESKLVDPRFINYANQVLGK